MWPEWIEVVNLDNHGGYAVLSKAEEAGEGREVTLATDGQRWTIVAGEQELSGGWSRGLCRESVGRRSHGRVRTVKTVWVKR